MTVGLSPDSQGSTVIGVSVAFGVLTSIVIVARLFTRLYVIKSVGIDDILITIAALLSWAFIIATVMAVNHGLGNHIQDVLLRGPQNMVSYAQIVWFSSIFYNATLGFIKTSVLALYMRLGDRTLRKLALVMICVVASQAMANVLTCIFQCGPIQKAWNTSLNGHCININAFYLANAALNIFTDLLTYTLPVRLVFRLQVPRKQQIALGVMLCLGLFACISSIIRITFIPQMLVSPDATWAITGAMYWSVIETNIGIMAASIPSFKALAKRYLPMLLGEYSSRNRSKTGGSNFQKISEGSQAHAGTAPEPRSRGLSIAKKDPYNIDRELKLVDLPALTSDSDSEASKRRDNDGIVTVVEQDRISNESTEKLNVPLGKIMARTDITTKVDDGHSFYRGDGDGSGRRQSRF